MGEKEICVKCGAWCQELRPHSGPRECRGPAGGHKATCGLALPSLATPSLGALPAFPPPAGAIVPSWYLLTFVAFSIHDIRCSAVHLLHVTISRFTEDHRS